jgi:hypothetical protein
VQHHRLLHLAENPCIDPGVVVGRAGRLGQRSRGHQDDPATLGLDETDLLFIGRDDIVDAHFGGRQQVIGAGAVGDQRVGARLSLGLRSPNELLRFRPAEAHAALGRVHRFGDAEAEIPQAMPELQRGVPVDGGAQPRVVIGQGIGDDMRGSIGDAIEIAGLMRDERDWRPNQRIGADRSVRIGELDLHRQIPSGGTSSQRRSFQL